MPFFNISRKNRCEDCSKLDICNSLLLRLTKQLELKPKSAYLTLKRDVINDVS